VLLALEGLLFARNLHTATNYDEGVYLASLDALRHGQTLGSEVFASQPPGFYALLRIVGAFSGYSIVAAREGFVLVAVLGCLGAYALGRALAGPPGGLAASALLAILPPFPSEAMRVDADVPSASLSLVALALAAYGLRRRAPLWLAAVAGAVLALAVSVKLFALLAAIPFAALGLRAGRRDWLAAAAGAGTVALAFVIAYAGVLGSLWDGAVQFHRDARSFPSPESSSHALRHFLELHTPSAWLALVGAAAAVVAWRRAWPLWLWTVAVVLFLLWQKPLFDHHLVLLCAAVAAAAGVGLGRIVEIAPRRAAAPAALALAAALAAGGAQQAHRIDLRITAEPDELVRASTRLAACPRPVATDQPIVAFRAHRVLPGQLVDTSLVRLATPSLPPAKALRELRDARVGAVFAARAFLHEPEILGGLRARYGRPVRDGTTLFFGARSC